MQEPELCLGHCQTSKTAKNCQLLTQKISITDVWQGLDTPLRVYFQTLFILTIVLNLEFPILAKLMFASFQEYI